MSNDEIEDLIRRLSPRAREVYDQIEMLVERPSREGTSPEEVSFVSYKGIQGALEELWMSGAGSAEELETLRLSKQGCVEVPLASTEPCPPLSNPTVRSHLPKPEEV